MAKASDTSHLDKFSQSELEDILVQLCDSEGVKVTPGEDNPLKNAGTNVLDKMGFGRIGKNLFGGGSKKETPKDDTPAPAPRPASDIIKDLPPDGKQGLVGIIQSAIAAAISGGLLGGGDTSKGGGSGGSPLLACFGNLLKGGGDKSRTANETQNQQSATDGSNAPAAGNMSLTDIKTPEALLGFITGNPALKTLVISGVQSFLAKFMAGGAAAPH